jgi:hypothetical protein
MRILVVLLLCSCAALNTMGMSEVCKNRYNSCLDSCPEARRAAGGPPPMSNAPPVDGSDRHLQISVAQCTEQCNAQAKSCH